MLTGRAAFTLQTPGFALFFKTTFMCKYLLIHAYKHLLCNRPTHQTLAIEIVVIFEFYWFSITHVAAKFTWLFRYQDTIVFSLVRKPVGPLSLLGCGHLKKSRKKKEKKIKKSRILTEMTIMLTAVYKRVNPPHLQFFFLKSAPPRKHFWKSPCVCACTSPAHINSFLPWKTLLGMMATYSGRRAITVCWGCCPRC